MPPVVTDSENTDDAQPPPAQVAQRSTSVPTGSAPVLAATQSDSACGDEATNIAVLGPLALVLTAENMLEKINLPLRNFEGRNQPIALGTETLLCTGTKVPEAMVPRACYAYGVVVVSGKAHSGPYRFRSYFEPWVVLPKPVQCSKAWGQFFVQVSKTPEHMETYISVKRIVDELLRAPMYKPMMPPESESTQHKMDRRELRQTRKQKEILEMESASLKVEIASLKETLAV